MKKPLIAMICAITMGCFSAGVSAEQTAPSQEPSANGNIQLASWWWDDGYYDYRWRDRRDWEDAHYRRAAWCDRHPRKCEAAWRRHHAREWCRHHPSRCSNW